MFRFLLPLLIIAAPAVAEAPLAVEMIKATATADTQVFALTGEIVARDPLRASFPIGGRIAAVMAQDGDLVAKGFALAQMESVQQEQALRAAEAGLSTALADQRQAVEDLARQDALLDRGATTRISRDSAEDALRIAEGGLTQARADLARAQKALEDTVLLAPTDATVIDRMVEPGQVVGAAQPVMELALGQAFDAVFNVPEVLMTTDIATDAIDLELIEYPGQRFSGVAREVSPLVDPLTGTVAVTVSVIDPPAVVSYGDAVRGAATFEDVPHIVLPFSAMSATADGPAVWVVDPESMAVSLHSIEIERFETERIILASGLEEGTLVVTRGAQLLYPGRIVQAAGGGK